MVDRGLNNAMLASIQPKLMDQMNLLKLVNRECIISDFLKTLTVIDFETD